MSMKYYTIGEIFRLKLLKNFNGIPYKHKSSISNALKGLKYKERKTAHGIAKTFSEKQIEEYNRK